MPKRDVEIQRNIAMAENAEMRSALWAIADGYDRTKREALTLEKAQALAKDTLERVKLSR